LATREISIYRDDIEKVSEIFSTIMLIKFLLIIISFIAISIIIFSFKRFSDDWLLYYLTFGIVLGEVLFPLWFYQGIEKMKYITIFNIIAKSIFIIFIFVFVQRKSDYLLVPLLNSLGFIISGVLALFIALQNFHIRYTRPKFYLIKWYIKEGWSIFLSRVYVFFYTNFNIFILGMMANNSIVGYFSTAQKITGGISSLYSVSNQVVYPYMARLSKIDLLRFTKKIIIYYILTFLFITLFILAFSHFIVMLIYGQYNREIDDILKILLISVVTSALGGILTQGLIIIKKYKQFNQILFLTAILNICLSPLAIYVDQGKGLAISNNIIYIFVILLCMKELYKKESNNVTI